MKRTSQQVKNTRPQRHGRAPRRAPHVLQHIAGTAVFVLLGLSVLGLIAVLSVMHAQLPSGSAASLSQGDTSTANVSTPDEQGVWIPIHSTASADLLAAARHSSLFTQNRSESGDHVTDLSRLVIPVFVRPLRHVSSVNGSLPDFYVIPILNLQGETTDAVELELNPAHTAVHVIAIVTYAHPHPLGAIPQVALHAAVASVETRHHVKQRSGTRAELVYFPLDAQQQQTGKLVWTSGGQFPADPLWLINGADGQEHIVGNDGAVYYSNQIPPS